MTTIMRASKKVKIIFTLFMLLIWSIISFTFNAGSGVLDLLFFLVFGVLLALAMALWKRRNLIYYVLKYLQFTFGFSILIYLIGYLFVALEPIVLA